MKLLLVVIIYCGAVLSTEDPLNEAIDHVRNRWGKFAVEIAFNLTLLERSEDSAELAGKINQQLHFTGACILTVTHGLEISIEKERRKAPMNFTIKSKCDSMSTAMDKLTGELSSLINEQFSEKNSERTDKIIEKVNEIHKEILSTLFVIVKSEMHTLNMAKMLDQLQQQEALIGDGLSGLGPINLSLEITETLETYLQTIYRNVDLIETLLQTKSQTDFLQLAGFPLRSIDDLIKSLENQLNAKNNADEKSEITTDEDRITLESEIKKLNVMTQSLADKLGAGDAYDPIARISNNARNQLNEILATTKTSLLREILRGFLVQQNAAVPKMVTQLGNQLENVKSQTLELGNMAAAEFDKNGIQEWNFVFVISSYYLLSQQSILLAKFNNAKKNMGEDGRQTWKRALKNIYIPQIHKGHDFWSVGPIDNMDYCHDDVEHQEGESSPNCKLCIGSIANFCDVYTRFINIFNSVLSQPLAQE